MRLHRRQIIAACAAFCTCGALTAEAQALALGPPRSLEEMARRGETEFPNIAHLRIDDLVDQQRGSVRLWLFDVREGAEFAVSHLSGAERIAPDISASAALDQIGARADGGVVVFYCSVGQRSSRLAARTGRGLEARGVCAVYNLRGGIFAWHNDARPLVDRFGPTPYVHPYSAAWRRLLTHPQLSAFYARTAGH